MKKRFLLHLSCAALFMSNTIDAQLVFSSIIPQYNMRPLDINDSGTTVGVINSQIYFYWQKNAEVVQIGSTPPDVFTLNVMIGEDNTKVVASMQDNITELLQFSIYDSNSQSWTNLGGLGGTFGSSISTPFAVSADNSTIVGLAYDDNNKARAVKWTQETGFVNLGSLFATSFSRADAISDDKNVIGGWQDQQNGSRSGAIWVDGVQSIIKDENGSMVGWVRAISYDGSKLGGNPLFGKFPYHYDRIANKVTYIKNTQFLTDMFYKGSVNGISNDGKLVIGYFGSLRMPNDEGFIWSEEMGYKSFTDYVQSFGIDTKGEYLYPTAISPDGKKFAGYTKTKKTYMLDLTSYLAAQNNNKSDVKIYPNPASNVLNISGLKSETKVKIYNIAGQLVKTSTSAQIDINNFPKGNYVVSYEVDGKTLRQKFIKQ